MGRIEIDEVKVLDKGYVGFRDKLGDDLTVVNAARVSFAKESEFLIDTSGYPSRQYLNDADARLIRFLAKSGHWSPFAHPHIQLEVKAPMMVVRQWHKTAIASVYAEDMHAWNEVSRRYTTVIAGEDEQPEFYIPDVWRSAPANKKQGSGEPVDNTDQQLAQGIFQRVLDETAIGYEELLEIGIAPEQARLALPAYALYTSFYWTASLSTILRWLKERLASDAQSEIREYAEAVRKIVEPLFPESFKAHGFGVEFIDTTTNSVEQRKVSSHLDLK